MPAYKDKARGTWFASFYYVDWTGKRKKKKKEGFTTLREAKAFERDFLNRSSGSPDMLFSSLVELYMEDCRTRMKPTSFYNKASIISNKLLPYFKDMPIDTIKPATVRIWQNTLIGHESNYSQTYLKSLHNQLSAIFNFAVKYYKLPTNSARICGAMGKKSPDKMEFWTVTEFNEFISYVKNPTYVLIFKILFFTGIRVGECLALTLNDFDFEMGTLNINKNFARIGHEDLIMEPKTPKSKRIVTIPKFLCYRVQDYVDNLYDYFPRERLFTCHRQTINQRIVVVCKRENLKKIRAHDLRHSHASLLIEEGFSPLLISERLGHENIETTLQTYSHLYPNKHNEVATSLQKYDNYETIDMTEVIK